MTGARAGGRAARPAGVPPAGGTPAGGTPAARLTGRGAVLMMFAACVFGLLVSGWLNWGTLVYAMFFMSSGLAAFYVRPGSLLPVVVSPPCVFLVACLCEKAVTSSGPTAALEGMVITLAGATPWLFAGTALNLVIALRRGLIREIRGVRAGSRDRS